MDLVSDKLFTMAMNSYTPPQEHIDIALAVEKNLKPEDMLLYLEWLNGKSMSFRIAYPDEDFRNVRDGCILTGAYMNHQSKTIETRE